MATRLVEIQIKADGSSYEQTADKIIQKNRQLNGDAIKGAEQVAAVLAKLKNNPAFQQGLMEGMSDELRKFTAEAPKVITLTNEMRVAAEKHESAVLKSRQALIPLAGAITVVTAAVAAQNPALASVINVVDNLAFSVVGAVAATGSWAAGFAALLSPIGLAIAATTALAGAVAFLTSRWAESRKEREAFERGFGSLQTRVEDLAAANEKELVTLRLRRELQAGLRNAQNEEERAGLRALAATAQRFEIEKIEQREAKELADKRRQAAEQSAREAKRLADAEAKERKRAAEQAEQAATRFFQSTLRQNEALAIQILSLTDGEAAIDAYRAKLLETEAATHNLTDAQRDQIKHQSELREGLRALRIEEEQRAAAAKTLAGNAEALAAQDRERLDGLQRELDLKTKLGGFELEKLQAGGGSQQAVLEKQFQLAQAARQAFENSPIEKAPGQLAALIHAEEIAMTRLQQFGRITVDLGQHIGRTLDDIFTAMIQGTLKSVDVGRAAVATVGRVVTDAFQQVIAKKLTFELDIFNNMRGLPGQANQALASGMSAVPGAGGGGGLLNMLFGGGGGAAGGGGWSSGFDAFDAGGFGGATAGGGGGGGFGGFLGTLGGGIANLFGTSGGGQGMFGGIGKFFSDIGSGNSIFGSAGAPILGGAFGLLMAGFTGGFKKSKIGGTIGSTVGGAIGSIWGPIGTLIGSTIGNLIGSLFNQTPNPTAILKAQFSGIFFDAIEGAFKPGGVSVNKLSAQDIGKGKVEQIRTEVQGALQAASQQWTDILNAFSPVGKQAIIPTLEGTNANLNNAFGRLKFSEGGKRSIEEELRDFTNFESGRGFFHAMRASIGAGFGATLEAAGLGRSAGEAREQFTRGVLHRGNRAEGGVLMFPEDSENAKKFIAAITNLAQLTSSLNEVGPRGIQPFITETDRQFLEHGFGTVFGGGDDPLGFIKNAEGLKEKIGPVLDFLKQAVGESTTIFGRGLIAALDAATASDAKAAFMQSLGDGTKEIIFKGITEAFLASAQFNDLLAPIQQIIRGFTQEAIATGEFSKA